MNSEACFPPKCFARKLLGSAEKAQKSVHLCKRRLLLFHQLIKNRNTLTFIRCFVSKKIMEITSSRRESRERLQRALNQCGKRRLTVQVEAFQTDICRNTYFSPGVNVPHKAVYPAVESVLFQLDFSARARTRTTEDFESALQKAD